MEQFVKQSLLDGSQVGQIVPEQVNHPLMHSSSYPIPVCRVRQEPERAVPDPNRWLLRKLVDAVFNFLGYQRIVKSWEQRVREKQWD